MEDLDRAYVINGDDLRRALAGLSGGTGFVKNPTETAARILDEIAQPLGDAGIRVTESSLASALEGFWVRVRATSGAMGTSNAELANPDEMASALFATLSRMAALREGDVVDAHICCEHSASPDRELNAMGTALAALNHGDWRLAIRALVPLNHRERARVITWLAGRFPVLDELPF